MLKFEFEKHTDRITGLAFVRDNRYVVSSSLDTLIVVWDIKIEGVPYTMNMNEDKITNLKVSRDHKHTCYSQDSSNLMTWSIPQLARNARYREHTEKINQLAFVPNTHDLMTIGNDGKAILWDYRNDTHLETRQFKGCLTHLAISREGHYALIASNIPCIYRWSLSKNCVNEYQL